MKLAFFRSRHTAYGRLVSAAAVLGAVVVLGATSFFVVGEGRWSWFDCFYMTIITLSTVGYAETLEGMNEIPEARGVTIGLRHFEQPHHRVRHRNDRPPHRG